MCAVDAPGATEVIDAWSSTLPVIGVAIRFLLREASNYDGSCDLFQSNVIFSICTQSAGELLPLSRFARNLRR